jgi:hypothetical protein
MGRAPLRRGGSYSRIVEFRLNKYIVISSSRFYCIVLQRGDKDKKEIKKCNGRAKKINRLSIF